MKDLKKKRIGLYTRVSTEMQTDGYSIQGQLNQLKKYCQFQGYKVVDEYTDRGISGKTTQRPELQRMLKDAKEDKLDCIMVYKTNRLARNTSDLLSIVERLYKLNVEFFSLTEKIEIATSTGKLMLQILASFSEFERNTIVENVYNGQRQRTIEGYYQGNLPLGYDKIPDSKKELIINQHEANIVKYIFESYAKGHGYRKIANALNHKFTVKGQILLTGIVKCPKCGAAMAASNTTNTLKNGTKKRIRYYSCSNFRNKGSKVCSANSVRADILEKYVMNRILEVIKSKNALKQLVEKVNKRSQIDKSSLNHDIAYKQSHYEDVKSKMNTLTKTIQDNPDLDSILKPTILNYQAELNQLKDQIGQLEQDKQAETPSYDAEIIANVLQAIFKDINKLEKSQLKSLYLTVIDRIDIRKDKHHKKQCYVTLKLNNNIIKQLFDNHTLDEVPFSTSSLFLPQTLYLTI